MIYIVYWTTLMFEYEGAHLTSKAYLTKKTLSSSEIAIVTVQVTLNRDLLIYWIGLFNWSLAYSEFTQ